MNICADVSEQNPFWSVLAQQVEEQGCSSCLDILDITQPELAAIIECSACGIDNCVEITTKMEKTTERMGIFTLPRDKL